MDLDDLIGRTTSDGLVVVGFTWLSHNRPGLILESSAGVVTTRELEVTVLEVE